MQKKIILQPTRQKQNSVLNTKFNLAQKRHFINFKVFYLHRMKRNY